MIPKPSWSQWIAIATFVVSIIGYVIHLESLHVDEVVEHNLSVKQRDSIINAITIQNFQLNELKIKLEKKIASDDKKEDAEDIRIDNMEKNEAVDHTRFEDFLLFTKPKK